MIFVDTGFFFAFFSAKDPDHSRCRAVFDYFKRHSDKKYSTVDCLSFVVMESLGIREALAVDEDFTHRFVTRPGPRPRA